MPKDKDAGHITVPLGRKSNVYISYIEITTLPLRIDVNS